jgi:quercetin dioxygenase-like cupin family protein
MLNRSGLCIVVLSLAAVAAFGADSAGGEAKAQIIRTILDRHEQTGVPGTEIVLGTGELPAGAASGWHVHPGDESGYVLKGDLILQTRGQPDRTLHAGDHFFNPRGAIHNLLAAPQTSGGTAVSTWVVDKGKPLAVPVN